MLVGLLPWMAAALLRPSPATALLRPLPCIGAGRARAARMQAVGTAALQLLELDDGSGLPPLEPPSGSGDGGEGDEDSGGDRRGLPWLLGPWAAAQWARYLTALDHHPLRVKVRRPAATAQQQQQGLQPHATAHRATRVCHPHVQAITAGMVGGLGDLAAQRLSCRQTDGTREIDARRNLGTARTCRAAAWACRAAAWMARGLRPPAAEPATPRAPSCNPTCQARGSMACASPGLVCTSATRCSNDCCRAPPLVHTQLHACGSLTAYACSLRRMRCHAATCTVTVDRSPNQVRQWGTVT